MDFQDFEFGEGEVIDSALSTDGGYRKFASSLPREKIPVQNNDWLGNRPRPGLRVAFYDSLEALLSYPDAPSPVGDKDLAEGTVVTVRTSSGDTTCQRGRVYVSWDDGKLRAIDRSHLRPSSGKIRTANSFRKVVADMGDLTGFFHGKGNTDLVHKATKDLWSLRKEGDSFVIERLFDGNGEPLKGV